MVNAIALRVVADALEPVFALKPELPRSQPGLLGAGKRRNTVKDTAHDNLEHMTIRLYQELALSFNAGSPFCRSR